MNGDGTDLTSSNIANRNALTSVVKAINGKFTLVGGTELVGTNSVIYWTSVEKSATHVYLLIYQLINLLKMDMMRSLK